MNYKENVKKKFDELAPSYSNNAIDFIKKKRLELIKKDINKNDKIIEIGCGSGNLLKHLECDNISGVDISPLMIEECKKILPKGKFLTGDAEKLQFKDNAFDKVIISEVLYYLPDLNKAISEAFRVLKKDGLLLITSLNKKYNFVRTFVKVLKIGVHDDISMSYISLKKLKKILTEKGFKIEEIKPIPIKMMPANYSLIFFIKAKK